MRSQSSTWRQKNSADRRGEWWRRTAWAFERSTSDKDAEAELGWALLGALAESKLITASDIDVVQIIAQLVALEEFDDDKGRHRVDRVH